jgi:hypothetical protein
MSSLAVRPRVLSQCLACVVAETAGQRKTLETLAARTGFGGISVDDSGIGFPDAVDRRLAFFFFHCLVGNELMRTALRRIRTDERHRFSPAVLVVGECSQSDALRYINLGFDDIVVLPEAARVLERRFTGQLATAIPYFETATYFGPDRRRSQRANPTQNAQRAPGDHRHVRYMIQRMPAGVEILRREVVISAAAAPVHQSNQATVNFA